MATLAIRFQTSPWLSARCLKLLCCPSCTIANAPLVLLLVDTLSILNRQINLNLRGSLSPSLSEHKLQNISVACLVPYQTFIQINVTSSMKSWTRCRLDKGYSWYTVNQQLEIQLGTMRANGPIVEFTTRLAVQCYWSQYKINNSLVFDWLRPVWNTVFVTSYDKHVWLTSPQYPTSTQSVTSIPEWCNCEALAHWHFPKPHVQV